MYRKAQKQTAQHPTLSINNNARKGNSKYADAAFNTYLTCFKLIKRNLNRTSKALLCHYNKIY